MRVTKMEMVCVTKKGDGVWWCVKQKREEREVYVCVKKGKCCLSRAIRS